MTTFPLTRFPSSPAFLLPGLGLLTVTLLLGLRIPHMDFVQTTNALTAFVTAFGGLAIVVLGWLYKINRQNAAQALEMERMKGEQEKIKAEADVDRIRNDLTWKGIVGRGFAEAQQQKHLMKTQRPDGSWAWIVSPEAKVVYQPIMMDLRELGLKNPDDRSLSWAIEQRYQQWMIDTICVSLNVHGNGCTAIAMTLAREEGSLLPAIRLPNDRA